MKKYMKKVYLKNIYTVKNKKRRDNMEIYTELKRLNKELNLNLDLMTFKEIQQDEGYKNMMNNSPVTLVEKNELNKCLSNLKYSDVIAIRLDVAKELDIVNTEIEESARTFKEMIQNTTEFIEELKTMFSMNNFMIFIDNFDVFVKEMQKTGVFLNEDNQGIDRLIRDVFKVGLSEWQRLSKIFMIIDKQSINDFIGGDYALERRFKKGKCRS